MPHKHSASSQRWRERHKRDPFIREARKKGYRARSAFKLIEIDQRFGLFAVGQRVLDLGAAPGSWSQIAAKAVHSPNKGKVFSIDVLQINGLDSIVYIKSDVESDEFSQVLHEAVGNAVDVLLCDLSPPLSGHAGRDRARADQLIRRAWEETKPFLRPKGSLLAKLWQGPEADTFVKDIKKNFATIRRIKPKASRQESSEFYLLAQGFTTNQGHS